MKGIVIGRDGQDWSGGGKGLDPFEHFLLFGLPNPRIIASEVGERAGNSRVALNEPTIKVAEI